MVFPKVLPQNKLITWSMCTASMVICITKLNGLQLWKIHSEMLWLLNSSGTETLSLHFQGPVLWSVQLTRLYLPGPLHLELPRFWYKVPGTLPGCNQFNTTKPTTIATNSRQHSDEEVRGLSGGFRFHLFSNTGTIDRDQGINGVLRLSCYGGFMVIHSKFTGLVVLKHNRARCQYALWFNTANTE